MGIIKSMAFFMLEWKKELYVDLCMYIHIVVLFFFILNLYAYYSFFVVLLNGNLGFSSLVQRIKIFLNSYEVE